MAKYLPHGTTFKINSVPVGGLVSVSIPDRSRGEAETTDSDSNFDRSFIPGLRDGGHVNLTFRHNPEDAGQEELEDNYDADGSAALVTCVITLPDVSTTGTGGRTYTFTGFVTAAPKGDLALVDDHAAEQSATIKVSGAVTIVGGAA